MENEFSRLELLINKDGLNKLSKSHIAVLGIGGVGGYVVEALVRSGIGEITIIDNDIVNITNLNRQIISLHSTINEKKIDVIEKRILDINPNCIVHKYDIYFDETTSDIIFNNKYNYVIDAIDSVKSKLHLINICTLNNIPIISCMGTGNKFDPTKLIVTDISKTHTCPLAKKIRQELSKLNIKKLKVVYSTEQPLRNNSSNTIGSTCFVPASAGLLLASQVITDILYIR